MAEKKTKERSRRVAYMAVSPARNPKEIYPHDKEAIPVIRKVKEGYRVVSESGRNMGTYATKEEAEKRLKQVEYFKHKKKKTNS